jgi:hypothetical protein
MRRRIAARSNRGESNRVRRAKPSPSLALPWRRLTLLVGLLALTWAVFAGVSGGQGARAGVLPGPLPLPVTLPSTCPTAPDPAALPDVAQLRRQNAFLARLGVRPTGSRAQGAYINWILARLRQINGVRITEQHFTINRWTDRSQALSMRVGGRTTTLPIAAPVPYGRPTGRRGETAPLVEIPDSEPITAANAAGRIVVRPAPAGVVPNYDFLLPVVSWGTYDPNHTIDPNGSFAGDFINYNARVIDLRAAAAAGAKGLLFVKDLPRAQLKNHYEPYEGTAWGVPAVFLGADQGQAITEALATGKPVTGHIVVRAGVRRISTPTVIATLPGQSPQRIVIDSHTDGTNAVEDNGPIAMVDMARYFAHRSLACRPRTFQFVFPTAHFYQRVASPTMRYGGAGVIAAQLDKDYDQGTVSSVVTIEHLGAIDYEPVPRGGGRPGEVLRPNGLRAIQFIAITPSPSLVSAVSDVVTHYDMQRTIMLQGSDAPGATTPSHCNFGGEGTPYNVHLLPTIGIIAAPQSLYDPTFGMAGIDFNVMHSEVLGFTDLLNRLGPMSQSAVAGDITTERMRRAAGASSCPPEN